MTASPAINRFQTLLKEADIASIAAAIATVAAVGAALSLSFPLLSLLMEQRGVSTSLNGANTAVSGLACIIMIPFITPLTRKLGVVNTLVIMIVLSTIFLVGFYFFESMPAWFLLRFVYSCSVVTIFVLSEFWINSAAPEASRGLILGIYGTVLGFGFAIGPAILAMVGTAGLMPFAIGGAIILLSAGPALYARHRQPVMEKTGKTPSVFPYLFIVPTATMSALVFGMAEQSDLALFPVYATRYGYNETSVALFVMILALGNLACQIPLGILSDKVRDRRNVMLGCALVGALGALMILVLVNNPWMLAACIFVWGGVIGGMYTVGLAHLGTRLTGTDLAQANAAFIMAYAIGMMVGPQFTGIAMDVMGPPGFGWAIFACFGLYIVVHVVRVSTSR